MFRRAFLGTLGRTIPGLAVGALLPSAFSAQQSIGKSRLIVRSARPEDLETPVHLLTTWMTPNDLFYVRSHFYTPSIEPGAWRLRVDGEVGTPLELSLAELRSFPSTTLVVTLECAGNGRAFFDPPVAGVQWEKGAVGTAAWRGVRLGEILRKAGVQPSTRYVWLDGADRGIGKAPDFIRSVPVDKAMHPDTLLAYEMNGEPLPVSHGFPLRAIVPGWEGAYSVKWLTHLQASARDHDGAFVQAGYRYPRRLVSPGTVVPPADTEPLRGMPVKSLITAPADHAAVGSDVRIVGFAWAGEREIRRVDVSVDAGRTWQEAELGRDRERYAWRQFEYRWRPSEAGSYVVFSRATDEGGRVQPIVPAWNPAGYLWNAVDRVRVNVGLTPPAVSSPAARAGAIDEPGASIAETRCTVCHDLRLIEQQRLDVDSWRREVDKMIGWGAAVGPDEKERLVTYLAGRYR
ncbi:MAG: sulfite oxidase [Acidobacteria bacterium]|nr:sulfite oxidase [Acidobacteriota bacterium]